MTTQNILTLPDPPVVQTRIVTYREAVREALREALDRDKRVFLMGEDVAYYGGCFAVSKGLLDAYGPERNTGYTVV